MKRKLLKRNKGFTLVECIVAIGVFAVMSALVMQILALAINQYRMNHHTEVDIDKQIENIAMDNALLVERETADIAINFVLNGGNTIVSGIKAEDVSIKNDPNQNSVSNRLEVNTFDVTFDQDSTNNSQDSSESMITGDVHIYGSKDIERITVEETTVEDGNNCKVSLNFQIYDANNILDSNASKAIKIVVPDSARMVKVTNNDYNKSTYLKLSSTNYRIYDKNLKDAAYGVNTIYQFTVSFEIDKDRYDAEYGSFGKYYIKPDSTYQGRSATFNDDVTPGIYNNVV